jgi:hypothetical protein
MGDEGSADPEAVIEFAGMSSMMNDVNVLKYKFITPPCHDAALYVHVRSGDWPVSRVFLPRGDSFKRMASDLYLRLNPPILPQV